MSNSSESGVPEAVVREALQPEVRRRLVACLASAGPMPVTDLAACVAGAEAGVDPEEVSAQRRRTVRAELYEHHLPALTETEVVAFDSLRAEVSLTEPEVAERVGR